MVAGVLLRLHPAWAPMWSWCNPAHCKITKSALIRCCCPAATGHNVTIIAADATPTAPLSVNCLDINLVSDWCPEQQLRPLISLIHCRSDRQ